MIWTLICAGILLIGVILAIVAHFQDWDIELIGVSAISNLLIGGIMTGVTLCMVAGANIPYLYNGEKIAMEEKYNSLTAKVSQAAQGDYTLYDMNSIYSEVEEYNALVRDKSRHNNSKWSNWLTADFWDELPLIDYQAIR